MRPELGTNVRPLEDLIDANQRTRKVFIVAGHSPDSLDRSVPALASKRVLALLHFYKERVRMFSYLNQEVDDIKFDTLAYTDRWEFIPEQTFYFGPQARAARLGGEHPQRHHGQLCCR